MEHKMKVLRLFKSIDKDGKLIIDIPKELGKKFEIIILPVTSGTYNSESPEYFECVAEDGTEYKVHDWTDEDFNKVSRESTYKEDDTKAEDVFDV
jgi:hypothetical protein